MLAWQLGQVVNGEVQMARKKKKAGFAEVIGAGFLREAHAVSRTARRELYDSMDIMSGPKRRCNCRRR